MPSRFIWSGKKKKEAAKKKEEVLQKLEEAVHSGNAFPLTEAKNKGVPLEEALKKANELGNAQLSLNGVDPANLHATFDELEKVFEKCFKRNFNSKPNWSIFADIDIYAWVFRNRVNEFLPTTTLPIFSLMWMKSTRRFSSAIKMNAAKRRRYRCCRLTRVSCNGRLT